MLEMRSRGKTHPVETPPPINNIQQQFAVSPGGFDGWVWIEFMNCYIYEFMNCYIYEDEDGMVRILPVEMPTLNDIQQQLGLS